MPSVIDDLMTLHHAPPSSEVLRYDPIDPEYGSALRKAFTFLRRHDSSRYSSATKLRVLRIAEAWEEATTDGLAIMADMPTLLTVERPYVFDEETEVKSGGVLAVALRYESGKIVMAVHEEARRRNVGSMLLRKLSAPQLAWVHRSNQGAHAFLLSNGFHPAAVNQSGGVCWQRGSTLDEGTEDGVDPLAAPTTRWEVSERGGTRAEL